MTGIHLRFGTPIWIGRTAVEVTVLLIGWSLGGNVGVGTIVFAALIGPLCSITLPLFGGRAIRRRDTSPRTTKPAASTEEESLSA